jgi:ligand-binding sensor domain-containing protein
MADDPMFVTLTRLNVTDRSTVATSVKMAATGYIVGSLAIDSHGKIWMGWGRTLATFDPETEATHSWNLPSYSGLVLLYGDGMDRNMVSLTIDPDGEIWVAAYHISAVFGFNPSSGSWDRTVNLKFVPVMGAGLAAPRTGVLTLTGVALSGGAVAPDAPPVFAVITTRSGSVKTLPVHVGDYAVTGSDEIVYSDYAGNVARLNLADGTSTQIATGVPLGGNPSAELALDSKGDLWFQLSAYRSAGVAELNLTTGAVTRFNFPYVIDPGGPGPASTPCPAGAFHCIPSNAVANPGIQAIVLDQRDNVWVVTELPSKDEPNQRSPMTPVVELQTSS